MNLKWIDVIFALDTSNNIRQRWPSDRVPFFQFDSIQFNYFDANTGRSINLLMLRRKIAGKSVWRTEFMKWQKLNPARVWPSQSKRARMRIYRNWANQDIYLLNHYWCNQCGMTLEHWPISSRGLCSMATKFNLLLSTIFDLIPNTRLPAKFFGHCSFRINWKKKWEKKREPLASFQLD